MTDSLQVTQTDENRAGRMVTAGRRCRRRSAPLVGEAGRCRPASGVLDSPRALALNGSGPAVIHRRHIIDSAACRSRAAATDRIRQVGSWVSPMVVDGGDTRPGAISVRVVSRGGGRHRRAMRDLAARPRGLQASAWGTSGRGRRRVGHRRGARSLRQANNAAARSGIQNLGDDENAGQAGVVEPGLAAAYHLYDQCLGRATITTQVSAPTTSRFSQRPRRRCGLRAGNL